MGKSIFDRNPITEMFSSVEEAMKCANSKELDGMLKNAFKGITSDPVLGKNNKSKQKMSVVIIADSDDSKLENKENMNYTRMQRYSAGGKKLRPIPADNKGLQALAKKNPKLVMDMGFDPNRIAGETKGKKNKKKGPKVPKNQNVVPGEAGNKLKTLLSSMTSGSSIGNTLGNIDPNFGQNIVDATNELNFQKKQ